MLRCGINSIHLTNKTLRKQPAARQRCATPWHSNMGKPAQRARSERGCGWADASSGARVPPLAVYQSPQTIRPCKENDKGSLNPFSGCLGVRASWVLSLAGSPDVAAGGGRRGEGGGGQRQGGATSGTERTTCFSWQPSQPAGRPRAQLIAWAALAAGASWPPLAHLQRQRPNELDYGGVTVRK